MIGEAIAPGGRMGCVRGVKLYKANPAYIPIRRMGTPIAAWLSGHRTAALVIGAEWRTDSDRDRGGFFMPPVKTAGDPCTAILIGTFGTGFAEPRR